MHNIIHKITLNVLKVSLNAQLSQLQKCYNLSSLDVEFCLIKAFKAFKCVKSKSLLSSYSAEYGSTVQVSHVKLSHHYTEITKKDSF